MTLCECGCGEEAKPRNRFINGHNRRGIRVPRTSPAQIAADKARSVRMTGRTRLPEFGAAISKGRLNSDICKAAYEAQIGVPLSQEHRDAILAAKTGVPHTSSEAHLAADDAKRGIPLSPKHIAALEPHWENMRGGNDIVQHHYIYDESDLSLNTVEMTRSDHTSLHNILRKLGYIIPHINLPEQDEEHRDDVL